MGSDPIPRGDEHGGADGLGNPGQRAQEGRHRQPALHRGRANAAFQHAMSGKPGPTYLDFPGDLLYAKIPEEQVDWSMSGRPILNARPLGDPEQVDALILAMSRAKKPVIISGSGVIWSRAWA